MTGQALRAIVHIGMPKTGTKTIQKWIRDNHQQLSQMGIESPDFWSPNHYWLAHMAEPNSEWDFWKFAAAKKAGLKNPELDKDSWAALVERQEEGLRSWVAENCRQILLFSSERLSELRRDGVIRFSQTMADLSQEQQVIVYVRNPLEQTVSAWSTQLLAGRQYMGDYLPSPEGNPASKLSLWEDVFKDKVTVRIFNNKESEDLNLIRDFARAAQIPWSFDFRMAERINQSMSWSMMRVLIRLNRNTASSDTNGQWNTSRATLARVLAILDPWNDCYVPSPCEVLTYEQYFAESNQRIQDRYFPEKNNLSEYERFRVRQEDRNKNSFSIQQDVDQLALNLAQLWMESQPKSDFSVSPPYYKRVEEIRHALGA